MNRGGGRGGYRAPSGPRPPSGPGAFSQRDEATQPVRTPDLDEPGQQYGDRQRLESAQRAAPIPSSPTPTAAPSPRVPMGQSEAIPPWLFEQATSRPDEPPTAGMELGPGPGREALGLPPTPTDPRDADRIAILQHVFNQSQSQVALDMIQELREGRPIRPAPLVIVRDAPVEQDDSMFLTEAVERDRAAQEPRFDNDGFLDDTEFDDEDDLPPPELTLPTDPAQLEPETGEEEVVDQAAIATEEGGLEVPVGEEGGEAPAAEGGEGGNAPQS